MHHNLKALRGALWTAQIVQAFQDWLRTDGDRLVAAAELLGGQPWRARADAVLAAVRNGVEVTDLTAELYQILRLLWLEFVDDLESDEAMRFLVIDPDDPRADDARLCAEALERGLRAIRSVTPAGGRTPEAA